MLFRSAADEEGLLKVAKAARHAHAGVVLQHIAHAARLPVGNQLAGVAGDGKRRVHRILRAQQPHARATHHLPADISTRQAFGRGIGAGAHRHGLQRGVIRGIVRFGAGLGLGHATLTGFEAGLRWQMLPGHWLQAAYTRIRGTNSDYDKPLFQMPADELSLT